MSVIFGELSAKSRAGSKMVVSRQHFGLSVGERSTVAATIAYFTCIEQGSSVLITADKPKAVSLASQTQSVLRKEIGKT